MNGDGALVARELLKLAAAKNVARPLGRAIKNVITGAADFGGGLAEGLGAGATGQTIGKVVGGGAAVGAGVGTAKAGKRKVDEFRYRHGLYSGGGY